MPTLRLDTPLFEVLGAKNAFLKRLEKLGIKTVRDLLRHFPSRYEDFSKVSNIADLSPGEEATVRGVVAEVRTKNAWRRHMPVTEAIIEDESGSIRAVWFNQPYLANALRPGRVANFAGRVSISDEGEAYFSNPSHEVLRSGPDGKSETKHTGRLVPIYPETKGLTSRGLRFIVSGIVKRPMAIPEWLPPDIAAAQGLPEIRQAFLSIHFPNAIEDASAARRRFLFEDLFLLQLANLHEKSLLTQQKAVSVPAEVERIRDILGKLPFELTPSQKRSLWEIVQDMERPYPMNRLLQGDVGSGKTIVAAIAAMIAAESGLQAAFMAPTEILAQQHFETFRKFVSAVAPEKYPVTALVTSGGAVIRYDNELEGKASKTEFWKKASTGEIPIIFGTHALIQDSADFKSLGLVIVDEQHRFGVRQRQALLREKSLVPHFVSMSATPIPRTLMMTVFGDLDVSLITELPAGRKPIETKAVAPNERDATYAFIRREIQAGRQAFVICPRIEPEAEDAGGAEGAKKKPAKRDFRIALDMKTVTEEYERLSKKVFPDLRLGMLHGKMKSKEKEAVMKQFKDGELDILISTSVIEVGVDVPNATIMMIENADRFGLAQLYQFRGRVGRGEHASYCFLFTEADSAGVRARLQAIVSAKNGFELAEKDLAIRGPGEFFGEAQSGFSDTAIEALRDPELVKASRDSALAIMKQDPKLAHYPALAARLMEFRKNLHLE